MYQIKFIQIFYYLKIFYLLQLQKLLARHYIYYKI